MSDVDTLKSLTLILVGPDRRRAAGEPYLRYIRNGLSVRQFQARWQNGAHK